MPTEYWLVNLATKEYTKVVDNGDFFDVDDWKTQTPFADANYIDLSMQKVWPDQKVSEYMVWGHDLCRDGMIVGLYFDKAHVSRAQAEAFLSSLRGKQDVAAAYFHELSFVPFTAPAVVEDAEVEALIAEIPLGEAYTGPAPAAEYASQAVGHLCMGDFDTGLEHLKAAAAEESEFGDAPTFAPLVKRLESIMARMKPAPGPRM